jgi:acetylornithine deacetylase
MNTRPSVIDMIGRLIATPSVSSSLPHLDMGNQAVIEWLAEVLENEGFEVEIQKVAEQPAKANLIATLGSGSDGLVLSGHTDTVPYDEGRWRSDPFTLEERDNRLYGLGTSDMKSFLALAIEAARGIDVAEMRHPLIILATADEETSMNGAKALVAENRRLGRYAVIGEPTGLHPVRQHKGIMMESIRLTGQSGHSSNPAYGNNAMEGMADIIQELRAYRAELQSRYQNPAFELPVPTLNLGHIHGGDSPNRICGECELQIDLRPLPGMDINELRNSLRSRLQPLAAARGLNLELEPLFDGIPGMQTDEDAEIVRIAEKLTGHSSESVAFGTEGPFLSSLGMETIIMGPGDIALAHQPDEYLSLSHIQPAIDILRQLIKRFCL